MKISFVDTKSKYKILEGLAKVTLKVNAVHSCNILTEQKESSTVTRRNPGGIISKWGLNLLKQEIIHQTQKMKANFYASQHLENPFAVKGDMVGSQNKRNELLQVQPEMAIIAMSAPEEGDETAAEISHQKVRNCRKFQTALGVRCVQEFTKLHNLTIKNCPWHAQRCSTRSSRS